MKPNVSTRGFRPLVMEIVEFGFMIRMLFFGADISR